MMSDAHASPGRSRTRCQQSTESTDALASPLQDKAGAVAVRQPYLRVVGLEEDTEGNSRSMPTFT